MADMLHLADRVLGRPLAVTRSKAEVILGVLGPRLNLDVAAINSDEARTREALSTTDNIATIGVTGTLVNRALGMSPQSGLTSYQQISADLDTAIADPTVRGILLDIDSGGGEVAGLFDLVDAIKAADAIKPVVAAVNDEAFSAAYAIASAAREVYTTKTGGVGSIGVVACHVDQSAADEQAGLKVTYVYEGDHKVDGNSHEPLSDTARAAISADVEAAYDMFVGAVAANRSRTRQQIAQTEAACYYGQAGVDAGLADALGGKAAALASLQATFTVTDNERSLMGRISDLTADLATERAKANELRTALAEARDREVNALVADLHETSAAAQTPIDASDIEEVVSLFQAGADNAARKLAGALRKASTVGAERPFVRAPHNPDPAPSVDQQVAARVAHMERTLKIASAQQSNFAPRRQR